VEQLKAGGAVTVGAAAMCAKEIVAVTIGAAEPSGSEVAAGTPQVVEQLKNAAAHQTITALPEAMHVREAETTVVLTAVPEAGVETELAMNQQQL